MYICLGGLYSICLLGQGVFDKDEVNELPIRRSILSITIQSRLSTWLWLVGIGQEMLVIGSQAGRIMGCSVWAACWNWKRGEILLGRATVICVSTLEKTHTHLSYWWENEIRPGRIGVDLCIEKRIRHKNTAQWFVILTERILQFASIAIIPIILGLTIIR